MTGVDVAAIRERARAALDAYFARATGYANSGLADYIQRIRKDHGAHIVGTEYRGCVCGEVLCGKDLLLAWCDELLASYEQKVQNFARETLRAADALAKIAQAEALCASFDPMSGSGRVRAFVGDLRALLSATPTAETVPPRVAGTGGPQNPAQSRGGGE